MQHVDAIFALAFRPFDRGGPMLALLFFSLAAGLLVCVVFRFTADPRKIRRAKDRVQAEILGVRLFRDQLAVALGCYAGIIRRSGTYLRVAAVPSVVALVPLALLFLQLDARLGWTPPQPGADFLITAQAAPGVGSEQLAIDLPPSLHLTAPPVRIVDEGRATWRLRADRPGNFTVTIRTGERAATKLVPVGLRLTSVSSSRSGGGFFTALANAGETSLPESSPVRVIQIEHESRSFALFSWSIEWWVAFLIFLFAAAFAWKPITGAEF